MITTLRCQINGEPASMEIESDITLLHLLREVLHLTGTKEGCGEGDCGACTVLIDGESVNACLYLAVQAQGKHILTIEGLAKDGALSKLQQAFINHGAIQCGFCSPGMLMSAQALLNKNKRPAEPEIRRAISGNLCRCTGYQAIVDAIRSLGETEENEN